MFNRYCDVKKDFSLLNEHANLINPIIRKAKFKNKKEQELILNYVHKIFFNQWKQKASK
tara:strand:- start:763 stop:939 length:177 start_codon:yes stop_codon:yes gene_type:complete